MWINIFILLITAVITLLIFYKLLYFHRETFRMMKCLCEVLKKMNNNFLILSEDVESILKIIKEKK